MSDLAMPIISFILSHPLYVSYFIFFSPYLIRLIYFLSPLFITTVLLSAAFFMSKEFFVLQSPAVGDFVVSCSAFLDRMGLAKKDYDEDDPCPQIHVETLLYETFFGSSVMEVEAIAKPEICEDLSGGDGEVEEKTTVLDPRLENASLSSDLLKMLDGFERMSCDVDGKRKVKPTHSLETHKKTNAVEEDVAASRQATLGRNDVELCSPNADISRTMDCSNLGTSMRREKEWKRTLACKLFEERHNVDGGEGMDSLWEAYEVNSDNQKQKHENKSTKGKNKKEKKNKSVDEFEDDEEGIGGGGQLCCLQAALKLSTGKMNLGIGRPNLVKISKAIKGLGWLHHASKHSKKVHNL